MIACAIPNALAALEPSVAIPIPNAVNLSSVSVLNFSPCSTISPVSSSPVFVICAIALVLASSNAAVSLPNFLLVL